MTGKSKGRDPFISRCREILDEHWQIVQCGEIGKDIIPELASPIAEILRAPKGISGSFRYVLPTQLVAKIADPTRDCRSLQAVGPDAPKSFDARTLCKKVIVPFDRKLDGVLGGSGDPYVSKPLRRETISEAESKHIKDRILWEKLCSVLGQVEKSSDPDVAARVLDQVLLEIQRLQQEHILSYPVPHRTSLPDALALLRRYLKKRTQGARLQATFVAILRTLGDKWGLFDEVVSAPITAADAPSNRPADIACRKNGRIVLAVEVKDQQLTLDLLEDKISSARQSKVTELLFLIRAARLTAGPEVEERAHREFPAGRNIYLLEADHFFEDLLALLGEKGRQTFLHNVGKALEELRLDLSHRQEWAALLRDLH